MDEAKAPVTSDPATWNFAVRHDHYVHSTVDTAAILKAIADLSVKVDSISGSGSPFNQLAQQLADSNARLQAAIDANTK